MKFTSDQHFFHKNICKFEPKSRPYGSVFEMNSSLITAWNTQVTKDEEVFFLGDFSFGSKHDTIQLAQQLNGRKHLIMGNHDKHSRNMYLECFASVQDYVVIHLAKGVRIQMAHKPERIVPGTDMWGICGHVHSSWRIDREKHIINVGWDAWGKFLDHNMITHIINGGYSGSDKSNL